MKVDVNAIQALAGKPAEVLEAIERMAKECLSARAMRHAKSMLRAIKNDYSLEAPTRASAGSLWRRLCTLRPEGSPHFSQVKRVSKSMLNSAGEPNLSEAPPESKTKKVIVHNVETHRDCGAPPGRPCLGDPLVELTVYNLDREQYADLQTEEEIRRALRERGHLRDDL